MKTFLKVIVGVFVAIVLLVAAIFYFTAGLADAADTFFKAVKRQDFAAARASMSEEFKASTSEAALREFLAKSALLNYKEASWNKREISNGRGELNGTIVTENGGSIPITLTFVKENGAWKIYSIQKPSAGLKGGDTSSSDLPRQDEQMTLVRQTLRDFTASLRAHSMAHFRDAASQLWQEQFPLEKFEDSFGSAYDGTAVFESAADATPQLEYADRLGDEGQLVVSGTVKGAKLIEFQAKYIREGTAWKLIGFRFKY